MAAIVTCYQENNVSYKQRLAELNIRPSSFYDAKRKSEPKEDNENVGVGIKWPRFFFVRPFFWRPVRPLAFDARREVRVDICPSGLFRP